VGLREHISGTTRPIFAIFCACGSVLLWWRCDTSDTSRFMGDVIFARNGLCGNMSIPLQRVTSFHGRAQANVPAALYWLHRVLDDGAHRDSLDESIVQGIPGWSLQCTIALLFFGCESRATHRTFTCCLCYSSGWTYGKMCSVEEVRCSAEYNGYCLNGGVCCHTEFAVDPFCM